MLKPSYIIQKFFKNISETTTIQGLNQALKHQNLSATATFSCPNGSFLTLELPKMILDGLDEFNIEVSISSKFQQLCRIDLMPLPVGIPLKDWEHLLIGSLKRGLEEIVSTC